MRPTSWSFFPAIWSQSLSVSLPHFSRALPLNCFQLPSILSQFICGSPRRATKHDGDQSSNSLKKRRRPGTACEIITLPVAHPDYLRKIAIVTWCHAARSRLYFEDAKRRGDCTRGRGLPLGVRPAK